MKKIKETACGFYPATTIFFALLLSCGLYGCDNTEVGGVDTVWDGTSSSQPRDLDDMGRTATISSAAELAWLAEASSNPGNNFYGYTFLLTSDIDLGNELWTPIGRTESSPFGGTFDGNGYTISGLSITSSSAAGKDDYVGLFGHCEAAKLIDIRVISGTINAGDHPAGVICGKMYEGEITDCHSQIYSIRGYNSVGGICGMLDGGTIRDCSNIANVSGGAYAGGICAVLNGKAENCANTGNVTGTGGNIGGISGSSDGRGYVFACSNSGNVTGTDNVGGISGATHGSITASCNTGRITASGENAGGVCGALTSNDNTPAITASYNTGGIHGGESAGGVCGLTDNNCRVVASYSTGGVNGTSNLGRVCGLLERPANENHFTQVFFACYWSGVSDVGIGAGDHEGEDCRRFGISAWPSAEGEGPGIDAEWGKGDGSGSGKYWSTLGSWSAGNSYPKLFFE